MADVFVSYKRDDRSRVRPLVRALQERGFTVWWDSRIETGENWIACIKRALDGAACVVVVWTPQSVAPDRNYVSEMIAVEANEGWQRGILLPVRMQNGPFAFPHNLRNAEDLTDWRGNTDDPGLARLARSISTHCGERELPESNELAAWLSAEDENNADVYRQFVRTFPHSRFAAEAEPRAAEIEQRVADIEISKAAATRIIEQFSNEVGKPSFTPPIPFGRVDKDKALACTPEELFDRLGQGSKAVLQADPGGGKTVTLLGWAQAYCASDAERIGVFIRLKEVANTRDDLIAHLTRLESTGQVSEAAWKALTRSGVLTLFCDGWNELSDDERETVGSMLDIHARSYPMAGLVVGSRPLAPEPLKGGHLLLFLQRLTYEQVRAIVEARLDEGAPGALAELRQSRSLRDLVRTPFFLSAFCETRLAGSTPTTREGLIRGMIVAGEQLPQHAGPLRQALGGQQAKYLSALAIEMLKRQQAELSNDDARRAVNQESTALLEADLVNKPADASVVLETLRDHHCLIEHTGADPSFRFQHQLINEWYASDEVRRVALLALSDEEARKKLDREILDHAAWTEATLFAAERPQDNDDGIRATSYLILRTIGIDPDFAADLAAVSPPEVWREIAPVVRLFLEEWQATAKHRVIQFVLRCGKDDFSEIVWEVIAAEQSSNGRQALQASRFVHPGVLGPDWSRKCAALSAEGRESLLAMLASNSGLEGAAMAVSAAVTDQEPKVQAAVAEMLDFYGFREELTELLEAVHPETWEDLVRTRRIDGLWEEPWRKPAIAAAQRVFSGMAPGPQRIDYALRLRSLGEDVSIDLVSELLELRIEDHHYEDRLFAGVAELESERLSAALLEKVLEGSRVTYYAARYIKKGTPISQERLLEAGRTRPRHGNRAILSPLLNRASLDTLFSELLAAHAEYRTTTGKDRKAIGDRYQVLKDALIDADKNVLAEMILDLVPTGSAEIAEASDILMRAYRSDSRHDEREPLRPELRARIIEVLVAWSAQLVADAMCDRYALHSLAEAIATFPSTSLLAPLRSLLSADLNRWRAEKEEFKVTIEQGKQPDPASGARMSYAYRYGQNMLSLATGRNADIAEDEHDQEETPVSHEMTDAVIDVLSEFVLDYEFGGDAARVIARLRPDPIIEIGSPRRFMSYDVRVAKERLEARSQRGTEAVGLIAGRFLDAIEQLKSEGSPEALQHAIKLSQSAVRMGCGKSLASLTKLVVENGSLEAISKHMLLRLLFGHDVDSGIAEQCLDQLDARREERRWEYEQNWFEWEELLVLMIFGGKPLDAARRLLAYDHHTRDHDERRIIEALGLCGHADALTALELVRDRCVEQRIIDEWCSAVHTIGNAEAGDKLLTTLLEMPEQTDWYRSRSVSGMVAELAERYVSLRERVLGIASSGAIADLGKIAGVLRHVDQEEFLADLLALPGDRLRALSGAIADALRGLCLERRPIDGSSGVYDVVPRPMAKCRARLFARASANDSGSGACTRLLEHIDQVREDYGETAEEARHPDITIGQPWPAVAQCAWEASARLVKRTGYA